MLEALDGSVMAFQNSQLFTKNYRNMTKNHGYELDILEVGVAYGTNIENVKKIIIENVSKLKSINHTKGVKVLLKSFDDSCITLRILVWVNVLNQAIADAEVMECIYNVFNKNGIEIPFPQREITIKQASPDISKITKNSSKDQ
jgi:small-conductance mechanosensitive channel